jgi:two-component system, OmpR family, KDP operon response regulator KdpE
MRGPHPIALLVEDEKQIRRFVRTALEGHGWSVHETDTVAGGLLEASTRRPELIILDLGLPDGDGIDFLRVLRMRSDVTVIVLSARDREVDKVEALNAGADDYLTKPFGIAELLARVGAASRRRRREEGMPSLFEFGDVRIDTGSRTVHRGGAEIHLTPIEYRLLCLLVANEGKVLTHTQILTDIWGSTFSKEDHYLRVYMGHLRKKIEKEPGRPRHILTEPAVGYRLVQTPRY